MVILLLLLSLENIVAIYFLPPSYHQPTERSFIFTLKVVEIDQDLYWNTMLLVVSLLNYTKDCLSL